MVRKREKCTMTSSIKIWLDEGSQEGIIFQSTAITNLRNVRLELFKDRHLTITQKKYSMIYIRWQNMIFGYSEKM